MHPTIKNFNNTMKNDWRTRIAGRPGTMGEFTIMNKSIGYWLKVAVFLGVSYWALRYVQGDPWSPKELIGKTRGR